jgi:hypothetical protein
MQTREQLIHPFDAGLELIAVGKETAHRQVLFHRHTRKDAPPFRDDRHRFAHDLRRLPVGNILTVKDNAPAGGARIAAQRAEQGGFPAPLAPISVTISPCLICRLTLCSA